MGRPYRHLEVERDGHIAMLWLDRPEKLNAMSADMWDDIPAAMADFCGDEEVRVVILAGRGPSFTVGIDVAMLAELAPRASSQAATNVATYQTIRRLQRTASCFAEFPKPVIAAVHGHCLGAGMDLISACDLRLSTTDAVFSIRETRMGIVADVGALQRLPAIVGAGWVAELALTGKDVDADFALRIGLLNGVYDDLPSLLEGAVALANQIAANSPLVVQGVKRVLAANDGRTVEQALDHVAHWNAAYGMSNDLALVSGETEVEG